MNRLLWAVFLYCIEIEIMEDIGLKQLNRFCIGLAGAGGLGSNAAIALVRAGIEKIVIADFDRVEASNLNRQYFFTDQIGLPKVEALKENALRINRNISVETHFLRITPENAPMLFACCDLIIEAFDKAEEKIMLMETVTQHLPQIPLIMGSGISGWGRSNEIRCNRIGNIVICGDTDTEVGENAPPLAPRVGMVACMQANEALRILLGGE